MQLDPQAGSQRIHYGLVQGDPACEKNLARLTNSLGQRRGANCNRLHDAASDFAASHAPRDQAHHFRLGEYRAGAADRVSLGRRFGERGEIRHLSRQGHRHHLDESARAGGAFVVHLEAQQKALAIDRERLRILAADVDHRPARTAPRG